MQLTIFITLVSILIASYVQSAIVKGSYIVKLKGENSKALNKHIKYVENLISKSSGENKIKSLFAELGPMYNAIFTEEVVKKVRLMSEVEYVEVDRIGKLSSVQTKAPWNLARISHRTKPGGTKNYNYGADGSGVTVYVIDSGIYISHYEFQGRARLDVTFGSDNDIDEIGHGTYVAGIIGCNTYGVAKKVDLVAVKVTDGLGSIKTSHIIAALSWVVGDKKGVKGNVINMSLGFDKSDALNQAVAATIGKGFTVVTAAGNKNSDVCNRSPASVDRAITVGSIDDRDTRDPDSNFGRCVTVFAPGVDITSTWKIFGTQTDSGTSAAAPHVAGIAACLLSQEPESAAAIKKRIINLASKDKIKKVGTDTFNRLVFYGV